MNNTFKTIIEENNALISRIGASTGDVARLAHRLSITTYRLEELLSQAQAQFKAGDRHATFNRQTIEYAAAPLNGK